MWKWNDKVACDAHASGSGGAGPHVLNALHIHSPRAHGLNRSNVSHSLSSSIHRTHLRHL